MMWWSTFLLFFPVVLSLDTESRIVNGRLAQDGEFPYQVSLKRNNKHACGGSIITPKHVLTAAHCVYKWPAQKLTLVAGQLKLNTADTIRRSVQRVIPHPDYNDNKGLANDVAVIEIDQEWPLDNKFIGQVSLSAGPIPANFPCVVSGWGVLRSGSNDVSEELQATDVYLLDQVECQRRYDVIKFNLEPGMICAVNDNRATDACQGDSGGPLVCAGSLTGIVSTGKGCADNSYPGIYSDVFYFLPWIVEAVTTNTVRPVVANTSMVVIENVTNTTTAGTDAVTAVTSSTEQQSFTYPDSTSVRNLVLQILNFLVSVFVTVLYH